MMTFLSRIATWFCGPSLPERRSIEFIGPDKEMVRVGNRYYIDIWSDRFFDCSGGWKPLFKHIMRLIQPSMIRADGALVGGTVASFDDMILVLGPSNDKGSIGRWDPDTEKWSEWDGQKWVETA